MALAANDHEKDGVFFAYEMMAKRGTEHTTFWQLLTNTIYWKVSFYGQSYLRPLAWLGGTIGVFTLLYTLLVGVKLPPIEAAWFGFLLSLKNALPFLGTITRFAPAPEGHVTWFAERMNSLTEPWINADWLIGLGVFQSLLGLFFFFFLLLGLRNRFRLK